VSERYDYAFWLGDLNYRIEGNRALLDKLLAKPDRRQALAAMGANDQVRRRFHILCGRVDWDLPVCCVVLSCIHSLTAMGANEQLRAAQRRGEAFVGWREGALSFAPTYKLDIGTVDQCDLRGIHPGQAQTWQLRTDLTENGLYVSRCRYGYSCHGGTGTTRRRSAEPRRGRIASCTRPAPPPPPSPPLLRQRPSARVWHGRRSSRARWRRGRSHTDHVVRRMPTAVCRAGAVLATHNPAITFCPS
jgi:hypothetical protein